jgi:hypothetical protein
LVLLTSTILVRDLLEALFLAMRGSGCSLLRRPDLLLALLWPCRHCGHSPPAQWQSCLLSLSSTLLGQLSTPGHSSGLPSSGLSPLELSVRSTWQTAPAQI